MDNLLKKIYKFIGKRVFILYLMTLIIFLYTVPYNKIMSYARPITLSRVMPDFNHMANAERYGDKYWSLELKRSAFYLERLLEYFGNRSDAYGLLGYVYHRRGQEENAIENYKKALELNPHFFWFYHNLALDAYNKGDYKKTVQLVSDAIGSTNLDSNQSFIFLSKVYRPILRYIPDAEDFVKGNLKTGYRGAYTLLILSLDHLNQNEEQLARSLQAIHSSFGRKDFFYYKAGVAAYKMGYIKLATDYFQKSLQIDDNNVDAIEYMARCWRKVKRDNVARLAEERAKFLRNSGEGNIYDVDKMVRDIRDRIF